eukprot:Skav225862  [mRNA]  locus=scaffold810:139541:143544:+ [translate_table: standard]
MILAPTSAMSVRGSSLILFDVRREASAASANALALAEALKAVAFVTDVEQDQRCRRSVAPASPMLILDGGKHDPAPDRTVSLQLSLKRLAEVMSAVHQLGADTHIACIIEGKALVLYALLPSGLGSLISYTPVVEV